MSTLSKCTLSGKDSALADKHSWEEKHYETDLDVIKYYEDDQISWG